MAAEPPIIAATLAPDGSWAVTVDGTGRVAIWEAGFATTVRRLAFHGVSRAAVAAASQDELFVCWVDGDGVVWLFTSREGPGLQAVRMASGEVSALGLSPSGEAVLACRDGTLRGLGLGTSRFAWTMAVGVVPVVAVAVAGDGGRCFAAFADGSVRWYDPRTRESDLVGRGVPAQTLAVTPDGDVVATASADGVFQWWGALDGGAPELRLVGSAVTALALDASGRLGFLGFEDGTVRLHDVVSSGPGRPSIMDDDVQFTVYRPRILYVDRWASMLVFAHKTDLLVDPVRGPVDPVAEVAARARAHFGEAVLSSAADSRYGLVQGTRLRIVPDLPGVRCNPEAAETQWWERIHEVVFRLLAPRVLDGTHVRGAVRVWCGPVILGEVSVTISISADVGGESMSPVAESAQRYRKIFPSYSRRDVTLVKHFAEVARALGDEYLQDVLRLRPGEQWSPRLLQLIEEADVFQLFWSHNSMRSPRCREEWEHALSLQRPLFVRPLYWEEPLPEDPGLELPPVSLRALHFVKIPLGLTVDPEAAPASRAAAAVAEATAPTRPPLTPEPLRTTEAGGVGGTHRGPAERVGEDQSWPPTSGRPRSAPSRVLPAVIAALILLLLVVLVLIVTRR